MKKIDPKKEVTAALEWVANQCEKELSAIERAKTELENASHAGEGTQLAFARVKDFIGDCAYTSEVKENLVSAYFLKLGVEHTKQLN